MNEKNYILFVSAFSHEPSLFMEILAKAWQIHGSHGYLLKDFEFKSCVVCAEPGDLNVPKINKTMAQGVFQSSLVCPYESPVEMTEDLLEGAYLIYAVNKKTNEILNNRFYQHCCEKIAVSGIEVSGTTNVDSKEGLEKTYEDAENAIIFGWMDLVQYVELLQI